MLKILIVDDEIKIREVVKEYANVSGFDCDEAANGKQALEMIEKENYDCVIIDIMMPELDGFTTVKKIREIRKTAIIMLSARNEEEDKLYSFEIGVDDYVTKPFSPKELMARIKAVCERTGSKDKEKFIYQDMVLDIDGRKLTIDNEEINVTPKELDLLIYLVRNKGIALDRDRILNEVWKSDYYDDDRTVDTHIKMLRKSLGKYRDAIVTVRGMGYKFEV